jgi:hypothetical protein
MSTTYFFFVGSPPDIVTRVSNLDNKITIDLELSMLGTYTSTVYNVITENVEVTFSAPLSDPNTIVLNSLAKIALYDFITGHDVYVPDVRHLNRYSSSVTSAPTINHDINSGYAVSSLVTTTANELYICTDNTAGAAVWMQLVTV